MSARIVVVEDELDDVPFLEDYRVGVDAVYLGVGGRRTGRQNRVKRGHLWSNVRDVVEEGTRSYVRRLNIF